MSYDYTALPTVLNVKELLSQVGITTTAPDDLIESFLIDARDGIKLATRYQWVPAAGVRYFDGSGTGQQIVDEYVSISTIEVLTIPSVTTNQFLNFSEVENPYGAKTKVNIFKGPANATYGYWSRFPEGRQNIQVTATWGYSTTIPGDVWLAHLYEAAGQLANMNASNSSGPARLLSWTDADVSERYADGTANEILGWAKKVKETISNRTKARRRKTLRTY